MDDAVRIMKVDRLQAMVYVDRAALGRAAGEAAAARLRELIAKKPVSVIFAAAPSQNEFLETLVAAKGIDWGRVTAFHMDEYVGLPGSAPQSFGRWLRERIFDKVKPGAVHTLDGMAKGAAQECARYGALLKQSPPDITCMGIGENGHLAFNDPPVADFDDPEAVKVVELDLASRKQQVNDGCFAALDAVPKTAMTLTIPTLLSAPWIYCMVPGPRKAPAVKRTLEGTIATDCPATILRNHERAVLYLDKDSASLADTALAGR
ncbi:MAG TPA: glucosamine-6-phosphate deaminase [Planctomycetota bacterium]|nr:glucosamine-6-phosphate deaminase [Planctomycetota bacterium]